MIRTIKRNMAKQRLADMGVDHINKRMSQREDPTDKHSPKLWTRVLDGNLKEEADKYAKKAALQRKKLHEKHPVEKKK